GAVERGGAYRDDPPQPLPADRGRVRRAAAACPPGCRRQAGPACPGRRAERRGSLVRDAGRPVRPGGGWPGRTRLLPRRCAGAAGAERSRVGRSRAWRDGGRRRRDRRQPAGPPTGGGPLATERETAAQLADAEAWVLVTVPSLTGDPGAAGAAGVRAVVTIGDPAAPAGTGAAAPATPIRRLLACEAAAPGVTLGP